MSDQYIPPRSTPPRGITTTAAGVMPDAVPGPGAYLGDGRVSPTPLAPPASGFSTGVLAAMVFVVVAIIAAVVFSNRDMFGAATVQTPASTTINNNMAPATTAPAANPPVETAPAASPPAATTVDPVAPTPAPAPADPATPPAEAPAGPAPTVTP